MFIGIAYNLKIVNLIIWVGLLCVAGFADEPAPAEPITYHNIASSGSIRKEFPDLKAIFDGSAAAHKPKEEEAHGLNLFGIELGVGDDSFKRESEPYLPKGLPSLTDWKLSARARLDGLGVSARYRHPQSLLRSLNIGVLKYFDVLGALRVGMERDDVLRAFGQTPEHPQGGFQALISGAVSQYVGGTTVFENKQTIQGDKLIQGKALLLESGYSPLGENPGKPWNFSFLASGRYDDSSLRQAATTTNRAGLGYSVGVVFQEALNQLHVPFLQPRPGAKGNDFTLDRLVTRVNVSQSAVSSLAATGAVQVSFWAFNHVKFETGIQLTFIPSPNRALANESTWNLGGIFGLDFR